MSYRNPQIIVDRSSEIYAQGFANLGQQAAGMIEKENERKRLELERIKKKNDAFKLLQNEVSFNAYQDADKIYSKLEGNSLLDQFQNQYTNMLEGDGENEGAIKAQTILRTRGSDLSIDERKRLNKVVSDARAYKDLMINSGGAIQNDINEYKENITAENIEGDYVWKGDTDEKKFSNMLAMFSLSDQKVPGVESKKELKKIDGVNTISITSKINTKDPNFMKKMDALDLKNELEVDENGYATITWKQPIEKYGDGLIVKTPEAIDKVKTLETAKLVENGKPVPGLVQQESNIVTSYLNGKKVTATRQYLDIDKLEKNETLKSEYEAHAKGVLTTSLSEQKAYMKQRLGKEISLKEWKDKTPERKTEEIVSALQGNTIDDLGFGSFVPKAADDADVKFYKEQLGKDIVKGKTIYVKTNEKFSDIKQSKTTDTKGDNINEALSFIQDLKGDPRLEFNVDNFRDLASDIGLTVDAEANEEDAKSGNISRLVLGEYRGKKLSIDKNDDQSDIINKIVRVKYPKLSEAQYKKIVKEAGRLKPGEGVLAPEKENITWTPNGFSYD
jgi:hypothetical protein